MVSQNILIKFGLTKDENNLKLREVFKDKTILKEIHIDLYADNPLIGSSSPFMLLLRTIEKGVKIESNEERFALKRSDKYGTHCINVPRSEITECYYKEIYNGCIEFVFRIKNIYYKIVISN